MAHDNEQPGLGNTSEITPATNVDEHLKARPTPLFHYPRDGYVLVSPVYFYVDAGEFGVHEYQLDDQYGGQRYSGHTNDLGRLYRSVPATNRNGRGHFGFRAKIRNEWQPWGYVAFDIAAKPQITSFQNGGQLGARPFISGTKDSRASAVVQVSFDNGSTLSVNVPTPGQWTYQHTMDLTPGSHIVSVQYYIPWGEQETGRTDYRFTVVYDPALITLPKANDVIREPRPEVSGTGRNDGVTVTVYREGAAGGAYGYAIVRNGSWNVRLSQDLPEGSFVFHADSSFQGTHIGYSNKVPVTVDLRPAIPVITSPANASTQAMTFTVSGNRGEAGARVILFEDRGVTPVGQSDVLTGELWSASVTLPPGAAPLIAKQFKGDHESGRSEVRLFKVRPPALTSVSVTNPTLTTIEFSGAGLTNATVEITIVKGPAGATLPPAVVVTAGSWRTTSQNWPIGDYDLKIVQKVSDNAGGWIPSHEYLFKTSSELPPPTEVTYTVSNYTPTFTGKGVTNASVEVTDEANGNAVAPATTVTAQGWSTRAFQAWAPGSTRTVLILQKLGNAESDAVKRIINIDRFPAPTDLSYTVVDYTPILSGKGVSGATVHVTDKASGVAIAPPASVTAQVWSAQASARWEPNTTKVVLLVQKDGALASDPVEMTITVPLLAPIITAVEDDGLSPKISGTCWPGATLSLKYSDSATEHRPVGTSGTWTFKRDAGFAPDKQHTVTVIQTVAGRPSPPASQMFSVSPEKPVITEPDENADTHYDMTVRGINGYSGATLQLRDAQFGRNLGEPKQLTTHNAWFIELKKLEFRKYQIDAVQTIAGRPSLPSAVRSFFVVLVPPVIEVPAPNQSLARTSTLSGTAEPFGHVTIRRENSSEILLDKVPVDSLGKWRAEVTVPVGNYTVKGRQFLETHESKESAPRTYKVVPAAPVIESPGRGVHVGRQVVVSGLGYPGDTVLVTLTGNGGTVRASAPVLDDRTWSLMLETGQSLGPADLVAVASRDDFESAASAALPVVLGTYLPTIDEPAPGFWVENPLRFVGKGRTGVGRVVPWFNPETALSAGIAVTAQGWRGEATQPQLPGGQWCRFQQTITDAADGSTVSDWVESERFEITSIAPGARP
ncbi:hypothetical protein [Pseudomonas sp. VE 196-7]|uniref:hypothetical protein n=1 Tax=Pseudomonas sp. VE 196-7 TaxID=2956726 RepID=UPI0021D4D5B3|nr:hypothetical protein [Pseudomonas sp. VE 196-7]MCU7215434.1 hypothetical protein [Pseudomonas sp. VE 196-7]